MKISDASTQIRALTKAQTQNIMSISDYLHKRKIILDLLDSGINGINAINAITDSSTVNVSGSLPVSPSVQLQDEEDKTQPYFAGKVDKYMNLLKGAKNND